MLKLNCLQYPTYPIRLRFTETPPAPTPGVPPVVTPPATPPAATPPDLGFPADTPLTEMTEAQQIAYWKHHSRKHEATATARADYEQKAADSLELAELKKKNLTADQQALLAAREEGKTEGATVFLREAVVSRLLVLTGKTDEELAGALDLIDVSKLVKDNTLDLEKVTALATAIGTKAPAAPGIPPANAAQDALARQQQQLTPHGGGSIKQMQAEIIANHPNTQPTA